MQHKKGYIIRYKNYSLTYLNVGLHWVYNIFKISLGLLCLTPTMNAPCRKKAQRNIFIKNLAGTKNCYIYATENNTYTINWLKLIVSYYRSFKGGHWFEYYMIQSVSNVSEMCQCSSPYESYQSIQSQTISITAYVIWLIMVKPDQHRI